MRVLILLISLFISFPGLALNKVSMAKIQHWKTKNGADVYFVGALEVPMVDIKVIFSAGSSYDGANWGLASLTNALLEEGTVKENADQITANFDQVGAQYHSEVSRDMAVLALRSLVNPDYLNPAIKQFSKVLTSPSFPYSAFMRVKKQLLSNIQYKKQLPTSVATNAFYYTLYKNHPYGHPSEGTIKTLKNITESEVKAFYQRYYVAKNAAIIIVGDLRKKHAAKIAQEIIGSLPTGQSAEPLPALVDTVSKSQYITFPSAQNTILLGQIGIRPTDPYYFPLLVGNRILGGLPLSSILFEEVRNKRGLAYSAYSNFSLLKYGGPFYIELQTRVAKAHQALEVVQTVLRQFVEKGPSVSQLEAAKKNIIASFPLQLSTNAGLLASLTNIVIYHLPLNYLDTYRKKIQAVTVKQVKAAFQKLIHPKKMTIIVVGQN